MNVVERVFSPTKNRRLNELVGLLLLALALLLLLSLVSYTPLDPSLDTAGGYLTGNPAHNWIGLLGAGLSDLLLQVEGIAAFLVPVLIGMLGWTWLRSHHAGSPVSKLIGGVLCLLFAPALVGLLPGRLRWAHSIPIEGLTGRVLADTLVRYLNYPGAVVLSAIVLAVALYLTTTFSVGGLRQWAVVRFAFAAAWRDRWQNWRVRRAEHKEAKQAARALAKEEAALAAAPENDPHLFEDTRQDALPTRVRKRPDFWEEPVPAPPAQEFFNESGRQPDPAQKTKNAAKMEEFPSVPMPVTEPASKRNSPPPGSSHPQELHVQIGARADAVARPVTVTAKSVEGFRLPPSTLLHRSEEKQVIREDELREEARVLVEKYAEFDVHGQVVQINPGPVVTTFEFRPDAGVKYSRVVGLQDDLCLAMRAESILIERMPGKSTVGLQVPNTERETIWLRDMIEDESFAHNKSKLTLAMGKDINGRIVHADLATMPHVLIAGSTGSGKSVAINAMIMSVLFKATPEQVRLILVDPKRVELGMYEGVPHLFTPIITEPKLAANALRNAVREMERRLKLLASRSVRNLDQYNKLFESTPSLFEDATMNEEKPLPQIVIIIDELADLMMLDRANVEESITRLAQMARAVGIHLVLATQRPSVDVITGLIKANVPTRISFRLATKVDSRTILDSNGAESLLGRGDMLFLPPGTARVQRVHAPFVTEKEIAAVVDFWKAQGTAEYAQGFLEAPHDEKSRDNGDGAEDDGAQDELFQDAVRLVLEFGKASTSLLQRRMRIGYGRAAHLIDLMERDGIVGPADGSRPREILKPAGWLEEVEQSMR
jgi:S-DNA-T family DNA segregation ATPase FtsK/SpoIIIE